MNTYADELSYVDRWDAYCTGMISTHTLLDMIKRDEVFAQWCKRKVQAIRKRVEEANAEAK